ncbi:CubicO group peptidase (beta-lactamase class C family) [Lentzea flaviverrucosa]|uniref:CubicO group peptidase, beta-lactamase class C family n=1 Tax=Lentzea flaviverrucosa TaxID=200379 RepID=A0A1H9XQX6_9PSEU|nr:CubicO group peptidase (beta-lactamase class C family) [Lentzea flaviverrucosa]SES48103.1 CubicO group peptidase, beta-lactamase class C family [Lentzea flaviverrucosa]
MNAAEWITRRLPELLDEHGVVGAQLAVLADGEITDVAAGVLNTGTRAPVTTESLFQIASITKVWTATLVQELVNEGKLDLDGPVSGVLPGFRPVITPRQLLTHTSGLDGDLFHDTGSGDDAVEKFVARLANASQIAPPGEVWSYCNSGFTVLGRIVEVLRGNPFNTVLKERLAAPLGLAVATTYEERTASHAVGHEDGRPVPDPGPESDWPAGSALAMSARTLLAFARMHLATPAFAVMREPAVSLPDFGNHASWGLGWELPGYSGGLVIGHHGANRGLASFLRMAPERGIAVALLTNGGEAREVFDDVIENVFSELAAVRRPEPPTPPGAPGPVDERFLGTYRCAGHEVVVTQADHGGVRVVLDGEDREFVALRDDALIALEKPHTVLVLMGDLVHFGRAAARI